MTDSREQAALRDQCTVFLTGHGPVRPADLLATPARSRPSCAGSRAFGSFLTRRTSR